MTTDISTVTPIAAISDPEMVEFAEQAKRFTVSFVRCKEVPGGYLAQSGRFREVGGGVDSVADPGGADRRGGQLEAWFQRVLSGLRPFHYFNGASFYGGGGEPIMRRVRQGSLLDSYSRVWIVV